MTSSMRSPWLDASVAAAAVILVAVLAAGVVYWKAYQSQFDALRQHIGQLATSAAVQVDGDRHRLLTSPSQQGSSLHRELLAPLLSFHEQLPDLIYVYTAIERPDGVHFVLGTDQFGRFALGDTAIDPIMTRYAGDDIDLQRALRTHERVVNEEPEVEALRTYISGYAPFFDTSGEFVGVVGVDMWIRDFDRKMRSVRSAALWGLLVSVVGASGIGVVVLRLRRSQLDAQARDVAAMAAISREIQRAETQAWRADENANRATAADAAKTAFLANVSHELRTPMNGVIGAASLLANGSLDHKQRRLVHLIDMSAQSMVRIVHDLLDFASMESGYVQFERHSFDARSVLDDVMELLEPEAKRRHISLRCEVHPDLQTTIEGDSQRLRQVLCNLVSNALKFTSVGGVIIQLAADTQNCLRFEVSDSGIGISDSDRALLFQRFSQVDSSSVRSRGGVGLGLAISKRLVELAGGEIGCKSALGVGTTFWFTWPSVAPDRVATDEGHATADATD